MTITRTPYHEHTAPLYTHRAGDIDGCRNAVNDSRTALEVDGIRYHCGGVVQYIGT